MRKAKSRSLCTDRGLERLFLQLFSHLSQAERQRVSKELAQPFRRQWFLVDGRGVKRLEE